MAYDNQLAVLYVLALSLYAALVVWSAPMLGRAARSSLQSLRGALSTGGRPRLAAPAPKPRRAKLLLEELYGRG